MASITFKVIDTDCEAKDRSFFVPRVALVTRSITRIATVLGYPEYIPSTPPKRYKTLTWSGTSEQTAITTSTGDKVGDAKYIYSGAGQIDSAGNVISNYAKNFYTPCPASNFTPAIVISPVVPSLQGYCWHLDPASCPVCSDPPDFKQDVASNSISDEPFGLIGVGTGFHTITPTSLTNVGIQSIVAALADSGPNGTSNVPHDTFNSINAAWVQITANHNYSATLSDEYTDAEALAHAVVVNSNGATAENLPRTTGLISRYTSVTFDLNFSNLVIGEAYLATVNLWDSNGAQTTRGYGFTASKTTHTIHDSVPTPASGHTITVRIPTVAFV